MTPDQTASLLAYASAIDARVRRNDDTERGMQVQAWHRQLDPYDLADARQAVDEHYSRPGVDAVMPADVAAKVRAIRADRIERSGPLEPPANLSPREYIAWLRWTRAQVASGQLTPAPALPDAPIDPAIEAIAAGWSLP